jgi:hypothetical protein
MLRRIFAFVELDSYYEGFWIIESKAEVPPGLMEVTILVIAC